MRAGAFRSGLPGVTVAFVAASLTGIWACKTSQSSAPAATESAAAPVRGGTIDWAGMDHAQRKEHMKKVVLPTMKGIFADWNAKTYGDANCTLCHGEGVKEGKFDMPNPDLPPFSTEMFDQEPKMAAFMKEKVLPAMAESLGMKLYDPATNQGFGCMGCHPAPQ